MTMRCFRHVSWHGVWCIATTPSMRGYLAWAKRGEIVAFDPVREPGLDVWFAIGSTRDEAKAKLMHELGLTA